jgi:hypothetical protein
MKQPHAEVSFPVRLFDVKRLLSKWSERRTLPQTCRRPPGLRFPEKGGTFKVHLSGRKSLHTTHSTQQGNHHEAPQAKGRAGRVSPLDDAGSGGDGCTSPRTIHDFGGFDPALYDKSYPADGHPALAARAAELLRAEGWMASVNPDRGLDHGAWVPLMHLYPNHGVPVIQASMPSRLGPQSAFKYGRALAQLWKEGVLVVGSGSLTNNLFEFRQGRESQADYAGAFTAWIREAVQAGDEDKLLAALQDPRMRRARIPPPNISCRC